MSVSSTEGSSKPNTNGSSVVPSLIASGYVPKCESIVCEKRAHTLQCPMCIQLKLPPTFYCSQDCFKADWKRHNVMHKEKAVYQTPEFKYTGPLRPHYITPRRFVPEKIKRPEYWATGIPSEKERAPGIPIYDKRQIEGLRAAAALGREVLDLASSLARPGITTDEIDRAVHDFTISKGAYPSTLNYGEFPKSLCTSVNEVVCHGIPDCRPLEDGDIVNLDISLYLNGFHADLNETHCVGNVDDKSKQLMKVTHDALDLAIKAAKPGMLFREFGEIIEGHASKFGYGVVRTYCGHGIGEVFHAPPSIPHYARNKAVGSLKPGMIFTIEPMINMGTWKDILWKFDDWTSVTADGMRSAQFEHMLLVTETGCEVLTARKETSRRFWWEENPPK